MAEKTIYFDNPREAAEIVGRRGEILARIEQSLQLKLTSRDTWVKLEGDDAAVQNAYRFFELLRLARNQGVTLREHGIMLALRSFREGREGDLERLYASRIDVATGKPPVFARTFGQLAYLEAVKQKDIVFGIGPAGTGKTYLAMAMAVSSLVRGEVSRIILTRPAVEAGEKLGYLPGDFQEKVFPYLRPLYDALYDMMSPDDIEKHIARGVIEVAPLAYMRGRTLNHAFVILDEAQNTTPEQMKMFLTRIGIGAKAVVTGDVTQIDLQRGQKSGLIEARQILREVRGIAFTEFQKEDVVRHPLVARIVSAYEAHTAALEAQLNDK